MLPESLKSNYLLRSIARRIIGVNILVCPEVHDSTITSLLTSLLSAYCIDRTPLELETCDSVLLVVWRNYAPAMSAINTKNIRNKTTEIETCPGIVALSDLNTWQGSYDCL